MTFGLIRCAQGLAGRVLLCRPNAPRPAWLTLLPVLLLAAGPGRAAEQEQVSSTSPWTWLEGRRDQVSRGVTRLGRNLDDWLSGEGIGEQVNETYLRVKLNQGYGIYDGYEAKLKLGGRLDLPTVSERWKLIFESDAEEFNSLGQNVLDHTASGESIGGFRYLDETESGWSLSHDIGIRSLAPTDPFYRFRAFYGMELDDVWSAGFKQKFWYYQSKGWGYDTEVSLIRELASDRFIRIASEAYFQDTEDVMELAQTITLHRTIGPMETISYEAGVLGVNKPVLRVDDYYLQLQYRKAVHEDWVILETTPQIVVSREEGWRPQPRFILNIEILFFDF